MTSSQDDLLVVAQMNQFGMEAMEQCRTTDASWILRHTIGYWMMQSPKKEEIRWDIPYAPAPQTYSPAHSPGALEYAASSSPAPPPFTSSFITRPMTFELREAVQRHHHIYEKLPISLYTKAFFIYPFDMPPRNVVTALLWYNHGLCCHMHGLTQGSSAALQEALHFYHHAYQMVLRECVTEPRRQDPMIQKYIGLLASAVCHNMALLYHLEFGHMMAARSLRCQLLQWIHAVEHGGDGVFFHLGIFLARMDDFRLAPAA